MLFAFLQHHTLLSKALLRTDADIKLSSMVLSFTEPAWSLSSFQNQPVVEQLVLLDYDVNLRLVEFTATSSLLQIS